MAVAVVQVCVDPRINHSVVRTHLKRKLRRLGLDADRIFIINEIAGNVGPNFSNTLDVMVKSKQEVVVCAVLHHDLCIAAAAGFQRPLQESVQAMADILARHGVNCPVLVGNIPTPSSVPQWFE